MTGKRPKFPLKAFVTFISVASLLLLTGSAVLLAGAEVKWVTNGIPMTRRVMDDFDPLVVPDGSGGAVIVWENASDRIRAQRVDINGNLQWGNNGIVVFTPISGSVRGFDVIADGGGGAFVVCDEAGHGIRGQYINAAGGFPWGAAGVDLHTGSFESENPRMCSDGAGGFLAAWENRQTVGSSGGTYDMLAQRVDNTGTPLWNAVAGGGAPVYIGAGEQTMPQVTVGASNGAIIAWQDERSGNAEVYMQRLDGTGAKQWAAAGVLIGTGGWNEYDSRGIASDSVGGAIVGWEFPGTSPDIFAQRVSGAGATQWTPGGQPICTESSAQWRPQVATNGAQGAFIAWDDYRSTNGDIYCQNVTSNGGNYWIADGFQVTIQPDAQREVRIVPDGLGGVILTWMDARHGYDYEVYAQRLNNAGSEFWTSTGVRVCSRDNGYCLPALANTANGDAIIAWRDTRNTPTTGYDIYAQRIISTGADIPPTWYFAEGTTRPGFDEYISIENSNAAQSDVKITYMLEGGATQEQTLSVPGRSRATVNVNTFLGTGVDNSARVETTNNVPVVAERPMYFNYNGVWTGGHDVVGVNQTRQDWYFAEGTTRTEFDQYICLQNPEANTADVKITYMMQGGQTSEQTLSVLPNSRTTVNVKQVLGEGVDNSAKVETTNGVNIVAERPMYFNYKGAWTGGHDVVGTNNPSEVWYFAEGTTRTGFEEWVCIQNPNANPVEVLLTYMQDDGDNRLQTVFLPATSRETVWVNDFILGEHDVSIRVESSDGSLIIAERPMYFTYGVYNWTGGHDVLGY